MKARIVFFIAIILAAMAVGMLQPKASALVTGRTYTTDADFDEGILIGPEHTTVHDQLQLSKSTTTFPIMWIANSGEDTVSKWDTNTNTELARYRTWFGPAGYQGYVNHIGNDYAGAAPSRTCVDLQGNVYVANRHFDGKPADVIKILANDWIDRNHDGIMQTSTNSTALPMNDTNNNGRIDSNEIQDERIAWAVSVGPAGGLGRSLSIAPNGDIWLGLYNAQTYYRLNSTDGSILGGPINVSPNTPYGSVIDAQGILWGASLGWNLLRLDTNNGSVKVYDHSAYGSDYGIAMGTDEHGNTIVYQAEQGSRTYIQFNSSSQTFSNPASLQYPCLGIATDSKGNILASNQNTGTVSKFWPNGTLIWSAGAQVASEARGTVVDSNDDVWVIHRAANKLSKFNGTNGAPLGVFDTGDGPYTYSDATGLGLRRVIAGIGFWTVTFDSEASNMPWGTLSWNDLEPNGTSVSVRVRSSDDNATWSPWEDATNGVRLTATPNGRYLQIEATLKISQGETSPVLYDLTVQVGITHDVAVTNVIPDASWVYQGKLCHAGVNVTVANLGEAAENFTVTLYATNETATPSNITVGVQAVLNLLPNATLVLRFVWNSQSAQPCHWYNMTAVASTVPGETNTTNNMCSSPALVKVRLVGDVNGDGQVDLTDVGLAASAFLTTPGDQRWLPWGPYADIDNNGIIDLFDIALIAQNFGRTCV